MSIQYPEMYAHGYMKVKQKKNNEEIWNVEVHGIVLVCRYDTEPVFSYNKSRFSTTMKSGPRLPQLERALAQKRRPNTAINKINKKKICLKKKKKRVGFQD